MENSLCHNNSDRFSESEAVVQPLLTDLYQITMAYAYWKAGKTNDHSVFDLFFRKNPFRGEFTIFAGLEDCIKFLHNFRYSKSDITYLQSVMHNVDQGFWEYLANIDASQIVLHAVNEGCVVFPKIPLIRVEGPLPIVQLLETTLLNLVNYASLVATNAARFRIAVGNDIQLLEFGLRRAQGPNGGLSASKYCYIGGFDGTSNVLAGKKFGIPVKGTHAHAFVNSFSSISEIESTIGDLQPARGGAVPKETFMECAKKWHKKICPLLKVAENETNEGEFAAFFAYAVAFPSTFLCLLDTYSVVRSGLPNFFAVVMALNDFGYRGIGIRLDSGDLAYQSRLCRDAFCLVADTYSLPWISKLIIVASNDINEQTLRSLKEQNCFGNTQNHQIDSFGIGTHLVTCQKQPALGCVFKLVAINNEARMKLSEEVAKINLPGRKEVYRLYNAEGVAMLDLIQLSSEKAPQVNEKIMVRHPMIESKRAYVRPSRVEVLLKPYWSRNGSTQNFQSLQELKKRAKDSLASLREDVKRELNPTPYKVSVSDNLYHFLHDLWLKNAPVGEIM